MHHLNIMAHLGCNSYEAEVFGFFNASPHCWEFSMWLRARSRSSSPTTVTGLTISRPPLGGSSPPLSRERSQRDCDHVGHRLGSTKVESKLRHVGPKAKTSWKPSWAKLVLDASGCLGRWLQVVANSCKWMQVAASGCKWLLGQVVASGCKQLQVAANENCRHST